MNYVIKTGENYYATGNRRHKRGCVGQLVTSEITVNFCCSHNFFFRKLSSIVF